VNKHRFRMLFENIIIIFLFLTIIYYIVTFIISQFSDAKVKVPSFDFNLSIPSINTNFLLEKFTKEIPTVIKKDLNTSLNIKENNTSSNIYNITIPKEINTTRKSVSLPIKIKKEPVVQKSIPAIVKNKVIKKISTEEKQIIPKKINIKKENIILPKYNTVIPKEMMLKTLRAYIKNTIINVRRNSNILEDLSDDKSSIKIRITVFKNGEYKKITYMSGNKDLMEEVKMALNKSFPHKPNDLIKSQFPRYLRFKINFKNKQLN